MRLFAKGILKTENMWRGRPWVTETDPICLVTLFRISQSLLNCKIRAKGNKPAGADSECAKVHRTVASGWSLLTLNHSGSSAVLLRGSAERESDQISRRCCPGYRVEWKLGCVDSKAAFHGCLPVSLLFWTTILVVMLVFSNSKLP